MALLHSIPPSCALCMINYQNRTISYWTDIAYIIGVQSSEFRVLSSQISPTPWPTPRCCGRALIWWLYWALRNVMQCNTMQCNVCQCISMLRNALQCIAMQCNGFVIHIWPPFWKISNMAATISQYQRAPLLKWINMILSNNMPNLVLLYQK